MPSYHSIFNQINYSTMCGIPYIEFSQNKIPDLDYNKLKLPLKEVDLDIVDEALMYFRANVLFKNFPIKGDADKLLVYITVFISKCLEVANNQEPEKAKVFMKSLVDDCEWNPSYKTHFFNALVTIQQKEISDLQLYLKQVRKEVVARLCFILFDSDSKTLDLKYWLGFARKKFMGYEMPTFKK
jgi:actin related protein 2/3 complex subunit 3